MVSEVIVERGPAADGVWSVLADARDGARLQAIADARNGTAGLGNLYYVVRTPAIARDPDSGAYLFSLTLTLRRQPQADEVSLEPLVVGAIGAVTLDALPLASQIAGLSYAPPGELRPLFSRAGAFALRDASGSSLGDTTIQGASGHAGFTFGLDREQALAMLAALRGENGPLSFEALLTYRAIEAERPPVTMMVDFARSFDYLASRAADDRTFLRVDVESYLPGLAQAGAVSVDGGDVQGLASDFLRIAMPILSPVADSAEPRYLLTDVRPADGSTMSLRTQAHGGAVERNVRVSAPAHEVLQPLLQQASLDAYVHAYCPSTGEDGIERVISRQPATRGGPPTTGPEALASIGTTRAAMPAVMRASTATVSSKALLASDLVARPGNTRLQATWMLNDLVWHPIHDQHLPQIDGSNVLWPDRVDHDRYWYAPDISVVQPARTASAEVSPFLFSFRVVGHDAQGNAGLEATITLTLAAEMPQAVRKVWEERGKPQADPVPAGGLSVSLEIPYRDGGQDRVQSIGATSITQGEGGYVATFSLTDQWARLAYGALAIAGFQVQPVRVVTSYTFSAYVPVSDKDVEPAWGGKLAIFAEISPLVLSNRDSRAAPLMLASHAVTAAHLTPAATAATHLSAQPVLNAELLGILRRTYGIRTQGRSRREDLLLPCSDFGMLYTEIGEDGTSTAVGCRDAYTLGEAHLQLYDAITVDVGEAHPGFSVYRSLQVPGRFLVLPDAYTIGRFDPSDTRAYRPAIYLFSSVDAVDPSRNRCLAMATLQPGIQPFLLHRLLDHLKVNYHPNPQLEWPAELPVTPTYEWALPGGR